MPDVRVLHARCEEYEASTPYYALREPMRAALGLEPDRGARRRSSAACARSSPTPTRSSSRGSRCSAILLGLDLAPTPETAALDERFLAEALADVTFRFLVATLGAAPVDARRRGRAVHRRLERRPAAPALAGGADAPARPGHRPLRTPGRSGRPRTTTICASSRSTCCRSRSGHAAEIVEIATDAEPLRPHEVDELARRSGGNPLFLFELLTCRARDAAPIEALPDSVEAVVTADIDRLVALRQDRASARVGARRRPSTRICCARRFGTRWPSTSRSGSG